MSKNIGKIISKDLSGKQSQKLLHHDKKSATNALKTGSIKAIKKTAEASGDLIGNKIADKITQVLKSSSQNISETIESETGDIGFDKEIPKVR